MDLAIISLSWAVFEFAREAIDIARKNKKPYIVWLHTRLPETAGYTGTEAGREIQKILSDKFCKKLVCVSESVATDVTRVFGTSEKIKVIYPAVYHPQRFEVAPPAKSETTDGAILFAGRLSRNKGADIFINAFSKLLKERPELKAVVVGDGKEKDSLIDLSNKLGLQKSVTFLPLCDRASLLVQIRNCRVFCVSSRSESFCITLAEAVALGATVVAPNMGGPREILEYGKHGHLFKSEDSADLARMLKRAVLRGPSNKLFQKLSAIKRFDTSRQFGEIIRG
jgi:phosphatidylinositol alpha-mannosyltransferase